MTERLITIDSGIDINIRDIGDGPAVLFIHGWSLSGEVWDRQLRVVAEAGYRAVAMDQRGHGRSAAPLSGYDIEHLTSDAVGVLDVLEIETAVIVGWSLGGMVALRAACDFPNRVKAAILVASNGVAASRTASFPFGVPADGPLGVILAAEQRDRIALRRQAVGDPFKEPPALAVLDWLHRISLQTPSWAAMAAMRTLLCTDQTLRLGRLTVPITALVGTADPALSLRGARWLAERTGGRLVSFDCGHYPMLECADEFDAALLEAIDSEQCVRT